MAPLLIWEKKDLKSLKLEKEKIKNKANRWKEVIEEDSPMSIKESTLVE